jgi:hypothetical protein
MSAIPNPPNHHRWQFFRAGGFAQVKIQSAADLIHLDELDQKLWVALACPIAGLDFDPRTAAMIDTDKDGRIRAPELIAAAKWAGAMLKQPEMLMKGFDTLPLAAINDTSDEGRQLLGAARQILRSLGRPEAGNITLAQAMEGRAAFTTAVFNGDGVITPESAAEPATRDIVNQMIDCLGSVPDVSGKPGVNQERSDKFFAECAAYDAWQRAAEGPDAPAIFPIGQETATAAGAVHAIKAKVDDYFARCRAAAFDARLTPLLNRKEDDYAAATAHDITLSATELAGFPLARIAPDQPLPLDGAVNPAHASALAALRALAVRPLLGARAELTEGDWLTLLGKLDAYQKWQAAKAGATVEKLGLPRVRELLAGGAQQKINSIIAQDKALEAEAGAVGSLEQLLRYTRDLLRLCRNFVSFQDLYDENSSAIFQAGTLYLDRRACLLCLTVADASRHAAMAGLAGAYLAYCDCARKGSNETMSIVAIVTEGDDDNLMVGRNGIFYDRHGRDFDATVTKIVANPISMREAFWSPYKKLARLIEEYVAQKAAHAQTSVNTQLAAAATTVAAGTAPAVPAPAAAATPAASGAPVKRPFDPSVVALFSVAAAGLAAAFAAVMTFLGKFPKSELPLLFAGLALLISLPSVILAYIKLRKRSLGPILDANGWAINAKASINMPFGARLTCLPRLPQNSQLDKTELYPTRSAVWPKLLIAAFVLWWAYAILDDSGMLYRMTKNWEIPLGTKPENAKDPDQKKSSTTTAASDKNDAATK